MELSGNTRQPCSGCCGGIVGCGGCGGGFCDCCCGRCGGSGCDLEKLLEVCALQV
uniref:Uncharacterized protein n=1 Tax=Meloidogyne enterolobii TaxID=390850 RepID=A0A6V7WX21_MELEN|nr:unnamed protein product [Meloidogyne enterolobii]